MLIYLDTIVWYALIILIIPLSSFLQSLGILLVLTNNQISIITFFSEDTYTDEII